MGMELLAAAGWPTRSWIRGTVRLSYGIAASV